MAENPATWGPAERAVNEALDDYYEAMRSNPDLVGLSIVRQITDALRKAGELPSGSKEKQATATQNAQAFAAVTAIQDGEWDRHLLRLLSAIKRRLKMPTVTCPIHGLPATAGLGCAECPAPEQP